MLCLVSPNSLALACNLASWALVCAAYSFYSLWSGSADISRVPVVSWPSRVRIKC